MAKKLRKPAVAERYGDIDVRTVDRWVVDPALDFPRPMYINNVAYWDEDELNDWDRHCAAKGRQRRVNKPRQREESSAA